MGDSGVVNFTGASTSVRANEFSAPHIGIGTHSTTSNLHLAGDSPEMKIQDVVDQTTETAFKVVVDGGTTHFQSGTTFADGSDGTIKFQNMGGTNTHVTINSLGDLVAANNVSANTITAAKINDTFEITTAHDRDAPIKKYPEIVFKQGVFEGNDSTNTYTQGGYTVSASSVFSGYYPWEVFDENNPVGGNTGAGAGWASSGPGDFYDTYNGSTGEDLGITSHHTGSVTGEWIQIELPTSIILSSIDIESRSETTYNATGYDHGYPKDVVLYGSSDGSSWSTVKSFTTADKTASEKHTEAITSSTAYKYYALVVESIHVTSSTTVVWCSMGQLRLYGYEETSDPDTSVDTTITSVYNLPDTTGMKLYLDGDKGSTPTDYSGEGHTLTDNSESFSGNAWSFSSLASSNVTMSTGDFAMEGTHPHSVSLWFNCANVSSNATLFHVGTAAGEGDAKTSISLTETGHLGWIDGGDNQFVTSNAWHNLVYATQGSGGVRTCYLDGRKLGDAQVQDTFGDYPPFAMTTYSQYGYTVSANHTRSNYYPYNAFNNLTDDDDATNSRWWSSADVFSSNEYAGSTSDHCGSFQGAYLKLELPYRLICSHVNLWLRDYNNGTTPNPQSPKDFKIVGSNDDINWVELKAETNFVDTGNVAHPVIVNATKGYKYLAIVVTKVNSSTLVSLMDVQYHGHKENDTTRFPVSSGVQRYPHITMTGPAHRGYVVTESSYSTYNANYGYGWKAFDSTSSSVSSEFSWQTDSSTYGSSGDARTGVAVETITENSNTHVGSWVTLETPRKIRVSSLELTCPVSIDQYRPNSVVILGSDNNSTWNFLKGDISSTYTNDIRTITINSSVAYKYHMLLVKTIGSVDAGYATTAFLSDIRYYGTEEDLDIVARVGEGLDGKVANFRVYDKYLHEEQALELWDAQKDQFGRATSSVSVYKGHVGIGTTTPEAALTVMDEAEEMEEFPPKAMNGFETYMEGHGVFKASASIADNSSRVAWRAFTKSGALFWRSDNDGDDYNTTTGVYEGARQLGSNTPTGEYLTLELPYDVKLVKFSLLPFPDSTYYEAEFPRDFTVYGRKNRSDNWEIVQSFTDSSATAYYIENHYTLQSSDFYRSFAISVTKNNTENAGTASAFTSIGEWRLFGTRERGQSTIHDGELKLTKNLTVPRIGPPLDADDTPRRDRLVVEYNTSTNPTENGTVRDTSGSGLDGRMYDDAYYDATQKALVFDGTSDYVSMSDWKYDTGFVHSFSGWIKFKSPEETWCAVYGVGDASGSSRTNFTIWSKTNDDYFRTEADGATSYIDHVFEFTGNMDRWLHMAVVKSSARIDSTRIYMNGVLLPQRNATSADQNIALPNTPQNFNLNGFGPTGGSNGNVDLSNVKFYDVALTAVEVKRLYDMGRCDEGHHVVNFSKTRVGIGLGDGQAPRGPLDVRGEAPFIGPGLVIHQAGSGNWAGAQGTPGSMNGLFLTREGETGITTGSSYWNIATQSTGNSSLLFSHRGSATAYIQSNNNNNPLDFTGQHRTFIKDVPFSQAGDLEGLIVSSDQNKYIKISGDIETGSNAIMINESLPVVSLSTTINDKKCFGVISASEDPEQRSVAYGSFVTPFEKEKGDTRVYINSVGEGAMWVTDINGPLESGDYITTSNVPGYGQKQDGAGLMNYTVAKITMDCDFNPQDQPIQRIKRSNVIETHYTAMVPVVKPVPYEWVTTTVTANDEWSNVSLSPSDVTYAEWSNLEANIQNTYTLTYTQTSNVVYDVKYTKTTTANVTAEDAWDTVHIEPPTVTYAEYSNLDANVQNTYTLTYTMTTKVEATEAMYSNLSTEDKELFVPMYYQMVEQRVDAEYPGAVKHETMTDRLENALDDYGQLQWEDHPTETEKAYKIRYLDASGQQTDEANCVHMAAFVGCTYHCG